MKKLFFIFDKIEEVFSLILMFVLTVDVSIQVFCRYVLNNPITGTEELARFLFIWVVFIGASYVVKTKGHIGVVALVMFLPTKIRRIIKIVINILIVIMLIYILPSSFQFSHIMGRIGSSALGIPMNYIYSSVIVGFILMIIRLCLVTYKLIKNLNNEEMEMEV